MLVHPMSLEISQVRSPTTKAGFTCDFIYQIAILPSKALDFFPPVEEEVTFFRSCFFLVAMA